MITFIIPTINRHTLSRTINCLINQTNPNWKAIVVFDGIACEKYLDSRITSISIEKIGKQNFAGLVRNRAINMVDTEWIGFVDDDDTISYDYVEKFYEEIKINSSAKCIIFRMKTRFEPEKILPAAQHKDIIKNKVGISFVYKKEINILFEPCQTEDFYFLSKIKSLGHNIVISPYITYFVREAPCKMPTLNRVSIN